MKRFFPLMLSLVWLQASPGLQAAELTLKVLDKEPPQELDDAVRTRLQSKAVQLLEGGKPVYEFWFESGLPLPSKPASPAKALDQIKETTLLGAVAIGKTQRDYRDDEIAAGVYTMRFGLQPQDGDHLGTAEFSYFAVLIPAKLDRSPAGITDSKKMVKTSAKETAKGHPLVLSLRPPSGAETDRPKLNEPLPEHKSVRVTVPAKTATGEQTSALFEVVYAGSGHK